MRTFFYILVHSTTCCALDFYFQRTIYITVQIKEEIRTPHRTSYALRKVNSRFSASVLPDFLTVSII